jgi:hypothetical protein
MKRADLYRKNLINKILTEGKQDNNRLNLTLSGGYGTYSEVITLDEIENITENFTTHSSVIEFLNELVGKRIGGVLGEFGFTINESELDLTSTNYYDGYELNLPLIKENYNPIVELFDEIDNQLNPQQTKPNTPNKASNIPITKEPTQRQTPNIPIAAKVEKTQNPKRVDLIIKNVFDDKFLNYEMKTDVGGWKAIKSLSKDGKLMITWESVKEPSIYIECLAFPNDSNKIIVDVKNRKGEVLLNTFFEIYRIPTHEVIAEKFFRKTLFSLLKKYIDTSVIQIDPFNKNFVFWKTDNPNFSYSFSTPNKNKIILDLISFISTAKKPILDDFFEANNLKHKQGYLQTLLDSAEAAGIFRFKREGNEILILRGPNYKAFLEGKVRRVVSA